MEQRQVPSMAEIGLQILWICLELSKGRLGILRPNFLQVSSQLYFLLSPLTGFVLSLLRATLCLCHCMGLSHPAFLYLDTRCFILWLIHSFLAEMAKPWPKHRCLKSAHHGTLLKTGYWSLPSDIDLAHLHNNGLCTDL